jgi:probable F420-dependent oxidoreductase
MKFGIVSTNFGSYADPATIADLASVAERAGWDGFFVWDHLAYIWNGPAGEPWMLLAAAACSTSRIRLGTAVSPVARYRPHLLAGTVGTLDVLSGGRVVLGAGIGGVPEEFTAFGDPGDIATRAAMTDEGLTLLDALWRGEPVSHAGRFYSVRDVRLAPRPVQRPRPPIWIGGNSSAALRRASRWDGWLADSAGESAMSMSPEEFAARVARIRSHRDPTLPFDVVVEGYSVKSDVETPERYREAGATWWLEQIHDRRGDLDAMTARIEAGPPKR